MIARVNQSKAVVIAAAVSLFLVSVADAQPPGFGGGRGGFGGRGGPGVALAAGIFANG